MLLLDPRNGVNMNRRIQLHLTQQYNIEIRKNRQVSRLLADGFRIIDLQRVTDREVVVTLEQGQTAAG